MPDRDPARSPVPGAAGRAGEVVLGLAGTLLSVIPFTFSVLRALLAGGGERERVAAALGRWDDDPPAPPPPSGARGGRVFLVAGEPSGDRLAAAVATALAARRPGVELRGHGGARMAAAGVELDTDLAADAVMGVSAVLRAAPRFIGLYARTLRLLDGERPDCVVLVDYPGFNLRVAEAAKRRGIPVVWYVAPQIWAWAPWRATRIGRAVDDLLVILPFETAFHRDHGVEARYVGYPLFTDRDGEAPDAVVVRRLTAAGGPVVALLPGSRRKEIEGNLPGLLRVAAAVAAARPEVRFALPCAAPRLREAIDRIVGAGGVPVEVVDGNARTVLSVARAAACVSGTVTMECVHGVVPSVVVYGVGRLKRALLRRMVTVPHIALANLLAGREVFPEFTGELDDGAVRAVAAALVARLDDGPVRDGVVTELRALGDRLRRPGTAERVAAAVERHLSGVSGTPGN